MKILRYLIFLSILSGIFFVIYRQSDKKGFRKWWISFRMAAFIAAILAGLIPNPVEASETYIPSNSSSISIERVVDTLRGGFKPDPNQGKGIVYRIKEDAGLVRAAQEACKNADVQKDVNHLEEQLAKGNENPGIGRKPICKGVIEHRGKNGGRLYVRESDDVIEILAKSGKKKSNQQFVINRLKEIYD
jgi:putative component of toxin-antitoxin plasmid stabilization module